MTLDLMPDAPPEESLLMPDAEFQQQLALAAEGKGELFEESSVEDFKRG